MTKRLGIFLGLGFVGVVVLLTGMAWDAVAHASDPSLAGREGIFTLRNPGHALMGLGIGMVLVSLIGGCETLLASAASGRWARPGVHRAFLTVSTAVVLSAAAVTSWAAQAGDEHPAGAGPGRAASGQLAAAADGSHGRPGSGAEVAGGDAEPTTTSIAHDQVAAAVGGEDAAAAGHDRDAASSRVAGGHTPDTSSSPASGPTARRASGADEAHDHGDASSESAHDHTGDAAASTPAAPGDAGGTPRHDSPGPTPEVAAPAGTWAEMRYGPFALPPAGAGGDADHANVALPSLPKPCSNCFIQEFVPDLVYADGMSANLDTGLMLHHAVLFEAGRQDPTCSPNEPFPGKLGLRFFASGNERTSGSFPPGFGYYVDKGNWSGIFHVMNHSAEPKTVFFQVKMRWSKAAAGGIRPLTPIWLDMNNCRTSEYSVPAGPTSSHWEWASNLTGRIVATAGHVHDGGVRTTLTNQTTNQHICSSWAGRGKKAAYKGSIESMSGCTWDRVGTVKKGEVLDLESVYNSDKPIPDAMGIMMAFVYETEDLAAGTPAPPEVRGQTAPPESTPPPSRHDH